MGKVVSFLRIAASGCMADKPSGIAQADWAKEQWTEAMILNASRINQKRKHKIPDQPRYEEKIAGSSIKSWGSFIDPKFISRAGLTKSDIAAKHARAISEGYKKWVKHLDEAYAKGDGVDCKKFKEKVADGAENYAEKARMMMGFTGDKVRGYGCNVVITFWIANDPRVPGMIGPGDKMGGKPVDIIRPGLLVPFKGGMVALLNQGGYVVANAKFHPDIMQYENMRNNDFLSGLQDSVKYAKFAPGGDSHCDWVYNIDQGLSLELQISEK